MLSFPVEVPDGMQRSASGKYFLHVGKTGGSAFKNLLRAHNLQNPQASTPAFTHKVNFSHIVNFDSSGRAIFFIREPLTRFVSGFNSRLRRGARGNLPWTQAEEQAFSRFQSPNTLAEALRDPVDETQAAARKAIESVHHTQRKRSYEWYLGSVEYLETYRDRIAFIGEQEHLTADVELLKAELGIEETMSLPTDPVLSHRSPAWVETSLSEKAVSNLREWYANDIAIYEWCCRFIDEDPHRAKRQKSHRRKRTAMAASNAE